MSSKGVLQECHLSVSSQGAPQVGSLDFCDKQVLSLFLIIRVGIRVRGLHLVFFLFFGHWLLPSAVNWFFGPRTQDAVVIPMCGFAAGHLWWNFSQPAERSSSRWRASGGREKHRQFTWQQIQCSSMFFIFVFGDIDWLVISYYFIICLPSCLYFCRMIRFPSSHNFLGARRIGCGGSFVQSWPVDSLDLAVASQWLSPRKVCENGAIDKAMDKSKASKAVRLSENFLMFIQETQPSVSSILWSRISLSTGFFFVSKEWALQKHGRNSFLLSLELASMGCISVAKSSWLVFLLFRSQSF